MAELFKAKTLYRLHDGMAEHFSSGGFPGSEPDGQNYCLVLSAEYTDGCDLADCWIFSDQGNLHPGYTASPVPLGMQSMTEEVNPATLALDPDSDLAQALENLEEDDV